MSCLSNIVKSVSVVDDRGELQSFDPVLPASVIKWQMLGGAPALDARRRIPTKESLLDEINRLRVEVAQAQEEVKELGIEREQLAKQVTELRKEREMLETIVLEDETQSILKQAEQNAGQIVEQARKAAVEEAEKIKAQGYLDGLEQGASEARINYRNEHEPEVQKLQYMMQGLSAMKDDLMRENENEFVNLVFAVAEKVIGTNLEKKPQLLVSMLHEVLDRNRREAFVKIILSDDLMPAEATVSDQIREAVQKVAAQADVTVDTQAAPGTVMVETPGGFTDMSIPVQMENLHEAMLEE